MHLYVLDDDLNPVATDDVVAWADWFGRSGDERIVAQTMVGASWLSTVFLGLDYRSHGDGPPLLYETMVFPEAELLGRWTTRESALAGHDAAVADHRHELAKASN